MPDEQNSRINFKTKQHWTSANTDLSEFLVFWLHFLFKGGIHAWTILMILWPYRFIKRIMKIQNTEESVISKYNNTYKSLITNFYITANFIYLDFEKNWCFMQERSGNMKPLWFIQQLDLNRKLKANARQT